MTKRSKADNTTFAGLRRVTGFVGASAAVARATGWLAKIAPQIAARGIVTRTGRTADPESVRAGLEVRAGSQSHPEDRAPRAGSGGDIHSANAMMAIHEFASIAKTLDAAVRTSVSAVVGGAVRRPEEGSRRETDAGNNAGERFSRMIQQSSSGMQELTRIGSSERGSGLRGDRSFGAAGTEQQSTLSWNDLAARVNRALGVVGRLSGENGESSRGVGPRFERSRTSSEVDRVLTSAGKYIATSRARGWSGGPRASMFAPASFSRPKFAEPMRGVYGQESRSTAGAITINSTPTVVVNGSESSSDVERQVIGALRAHREELFDQFTRESVRRERTQF
jgi:hypothetical protein